MWHESKCKLIVCLLIFFAFSCKPIADQQSESKRIKYVAPEAGSADELDNICESKGVAEQISSENAAAFKEAIYFYLTEAFAMRSLVRHAQGFGETPDDFDHPPITINPGDALYNSAIPENCRSKSFTDYLFDVVQRDLKYNPENALGSALNKFNSETIFEISYPSDYKMEGIASCQAPGVLTARRQWIDDEKEALRKNLGRLCQDPSEFIRAIGVNAAIMSSYYAESKKPSRPELRGPEFFKVGYCSLVNEIKRTQDRRVNYQENIEPWLISGAGIAAGLISAPLNLLSGGASGAVLNTALIAASVGRSISRLMPVYRRLIAMQGLEKELGLQSGANCAELSLETQRLWKVAAWDLIFEVGGFAAGVILPGAGKAAISAASRAGLLEVTSIAAQAGKTLMLSFRGKRIPVGVNTLKNVIEQLGNHIDHQFASRIISTLDSKLDELIEFVDDAATRGRVINPATGVKGPPISGTGRELSEELSHEASGSLPRNADEIPAPRAIRNVPDLNIRDLGLKTGDEFTVMSRSGNSYGGSIVEINETRILYTDPSTGKNSWLSRSRLDESTLKPKITPRQGDVIEFRSLSGNKYSGQIKQVDADFIQVQAGDGSVSSLRRSRLVESRRQRFVVDEPLEIKSLSGNIYKGKFLSENAEYMVLQGADGEIIRLRQSRINQQSLQRVDLSDVNVVNENMTGQLVERKFQHVIELTDTPLAKVGKEGILERSFSGPHTVHYPANNTNLTSYSFHYVIESASGPHNISIHVPEKMPLINRIEAVRKLEAAIESLPVSQADAVSEIKLHMFDNIEDSYWQRVYDNFTRSAATGGKGQINFFPVYERLTDPRQAVEQILGIWNHELGHNVAHKLLGGSDPGLKWAAAKRRDRNIVSRYGENSAAEDFAEAVREYLLDGGKAGRSKWPNRFAELDRIFLDNPRAVPEAVAEVTEKMAEENISIVFAANGRLVFWGGGIVAAGGLGSMIIALYD